MNFTSSGPRGPAGPTGATGPVGPTGPAGGGGLQIVQFGGTLPGAVDAIKTSVATSTSPQSYSGAALNGAIGEGDILPYGRSLSVTTTAAAPGTYLGSVVFAVEGYDESLYDITIPLVSSSAATTYYSDPGIGFRVLSIDVIAQGGTGGTFKFGIGDLTLGLPVAPAAISGGVSAALVSHTRNATAGAPGAVTLNRPIATAPLGSISFLEPPAGDNDIVAYIPA